MLISCLLLLLEFAVADVDAVFVVVVVDVVDVVVSVAVAVAVAVTAAVVFVGVVAAVVCKELARFCQNDVATDLTKKLLMPNCPYC